MPFANVDIQRKATGHFSVTRQIDDAEFYVALQDGFWVLSRVTITGGKRCVSIHRTRTAAIEAAGGRFVATVD